MFQSREKFRGYTLMECRPLTGRTHQIRVHMAYINHPVVGDEVYNEGRDKTIAEIDVRNAVRSLGRFFLHAEKLSFTHPVTAERLEFKQQLPVELTSLLDIL